MHPDKVPSEYPRENEHIDSAENKTSKAYPSETGEGFQKLCGELYATGAAKRKKSAKQANNIYDFRPKNAFPTVFF